MLKPLTRRERRLFKELLPRINSEEKFKSFCELFNLNLEDLKREVQRLGLQMPDLEGPIKETVGAAE